jgi:subtilisin family serine protease
VGVAPGHIIVKFAPGVGKVAWESTDGVISFGISSLDQKMTQYGVHHINQLFPHKSSQLSHIYQFDFNPLYDAKDVARDFALDEHLAYAEPRYFHKACERDEPDDPNFVNGLQWFFSKVYAAEAWFVTHGSDSVIIGIVDTGVDYYDHPDLKDNHWTNWGEDADSNFIINARDWDGIDTDGNGFIDDFYGWDFAGLVGLPDNHPDEGYGGHGTHSAGICCATTNNGLTNAGMSWNCTFMPVKVSRDGEDLMRYPYEGIQYAVDNGAQVINLSWARTDDPSAFEQEIIDSAFAKGVILVAAAGNDEPGLTYTPPDVCPLTYPASYNHITAVAATDMTDRAAEFTYYGPWVDVSAPGNACYSNLWNNSYGMRSSTSAACALVSGVAGLCKVLEPEMNSDEFEARVDTTANIIEELNPSYAGMLGGGRLNAYRAVLGIPQPVEETYMISGEVPSGYALSQNHPNPFNPSTTISYSLPEAGQVELTIYNVRGQLVRSLVNQALPAGQHGVQWDGCDNRGQRATSGIYFYRLTVNSWSQAKKMMLIR